MNLLLHYENEIDWATDGYRLADAMPRHEWHLDGVKELRQAYESEDPRGMLLDGSEHVASVPWYVMTALVAKYGGELMENNGAIFYRWLDRHPEYKIGKGRFRKK